MSSTELANEEMKQSIKIAEQESLEHSILQKATVPRAKITHKGLQDIEDLNGETAALIRERDKEREKEDEERRERERQARLRAAEQHQRQRTDSVSLSSVPPDSPLTTQAPAWGGPPLIPLHAMSTDRYSPTTGTHEKPLVHSILTSASDYPLHEPELDITDLIHLDEEPPTAVGEICTSPTEGLPPVAEAVSPDEPQPTSPAAEVHTSITEPPSQVPKPETPIKPVFDLNALWLAPKEEAPPQETQETPALEPKDRPMGSNTAAAAVHQETTDQDFDMFLEKDQELEAEPRNQLPEDPEAAFKAIPPVWHGTVRFP